jgi:hypothetical protein
MPLTLDMLAAIDVRVDARVAEALRNRLTAWGTVTNLLGQTDAMVTFDGSAVSVPVKLAGDVAAYEGDRVGLILIGRWWTVIAPLTRYWPGYAGDSKMQAVGSSTSSSMVDTPVVVQCTLVKRWSETRLRVGITGSAWLATAGKAARWGAHFTSPTHAPYDIQVVDGYYDQSGMHLAWTDWATVPSGDLPAGTYTARVQWSNTDGVTSINTSAVDRVSLEVAEIAPS